ncbi:threonine synthase [Shumkonia mesophila]|uniref:threonine synthase n=1 Tax=Shumkonia mesophila TaxID=2838854 RepID=UPI0029347431|nr:threonine synthase [Shumkonia mesophila]
MARSSARYVCPACAATRDTETPLWRCPECASILDLADGPGLTPAAIDKTDTSPWRYAAALRVPRDGAISMGEGGTPLIERRWNGRAVHLKMDYLAPTGSFKDRGVAVLMSYLKQHGVASILEDSSGNAGAAMAAYSAAAGIACRILVPASAPAGKLVQMRAMGADVVPIEGSRQDVSDAALAEAEKTFYASHNWQPFFLEGTKTVAYEIWEQLGFRAPDNVIAPAGGGSNVIGCHIGFRELLAAGQIDRMPRIFGIQAANCGPVAAAFAAGADDYIPTETTATVADGIALSRPVRLRQMLAAARQTGGAIAAVAEDEIVAALKSLLRQGLFVEPTSAAGAAGLGKLIAAGTIAANDTTVLILTGSGLKASARIGGLLGLDA